jgi:hypothetical protein
METSIAALVHGWRKADPSQHYYVIVDVADYDSDEVWQSAAKLGPEMYWNQAKHLNATMLGELKGRVLTRAEVDQVAQTGLELFRALRELSEIEAENARDETGWDHENLIGWYKTVERVFFAAAAHDVLIGHAVDNKGVHSHAGSLLQVARLAIDRARGEWAEKIQDDPGFDPDPADYLLLQDMPEGLRAVARSEFVRAKFAAAAAPEGDDPEEPEQPEPTPQELTAAAAAVTPAAARSAGRERAEALRARFAPSKTIDWERNHD